MSRRSFLSSALIAGVAAYPFLASGQNLSIGLIGGASLTDAARDVTRATPGYLGTRVWSQSKDGKVALSWVGVNGREERQIVESVMNQFPDSWRAEWLRLKGLAQWAEYYHSLETQVAEESEDEEESVCARA
jgi:hypothetical protein